MAQRPVVTLTTESDLLDVPQTGDTYLLAADVAVTGNITVTGTVDGRDVAADGALAATALQSETSHADVLVDGDFGSSGLMTTDGAGGYSITTNGSANWDTAYGWGNHASGGYLTSASIDTLAELNAIVADATLIDTGDSRLSDARTPTAHAHEGTAILSTGEVGGTKVLTENGAGGATWAAPAGGGAFSADAQTQITPSTAIVLDEATGDEDALRIDYTTNKATSGDDTGLVVNQTDTASPGTSLLADFQVAGASVLKLQPDGAVLGPDVKFGVDANNYLSVTTSQCRLRSDAVNVYDASKTKATFLVGSDTSSGDCFTFTQNNPAANEMTASSGVQSMMYITPVVNQSGTAGYNGILVNATETALGSGASNLIDLQVGGVSKASIDNAGKVWLDPAGTLGTTTGLWFGDGDTGIYEKYDDVLHIQVGGVDILRSGSGWGIRSGNNTKWGIVDEEPSATNPVFCPGQDTDTGIGRAAADQLSLIAGGVEGIRVTESGSYIETDLKGGTNAETSGTFYTAKITPTYNQASGTAANTDLLINRTETAIGSGDQLLADFQVGGVSKASIDNAGKWSIGGGNSLISETATDTIGFDFATYGTYWKISRTRGIWSSIAAGKGPLLRSEYPTATVPTVCPREDDTNTGLGRGAGVDQLSLIAGGVEGMRISETANVITTDIDAGDNAAGNIGALTSIKSAIATVSSSAAATLTATSLIPAGCFMIGLTARVTTTFGNSTGLTSFDIGDGADVDRWGAAIAITSGTTVDITNATAATHGSYAAANNVVLTANGGNFDATGVIELLIHYISLTAPTG